MADKVTPREESLVRQSMVMVKGFLAFEERGAIRGWNEALEYAASWIEYYIKGEPDARTVEFAANMAMSIRAARKPWK